MGILCPPNSFNVFEEALEEFVVRKFTRQSSSDKFTARRSGHRESLAEKIVSGDDQLSYLLCFEDRMEALREMFSYSSSHMRMFS